MYLSFSLPQLAEFDKSINLFCLFLPTLQPFNLELIQSVLFIINKIFKTFNFFFHLVHILLTNYLLKRVLHD